MNKKPSPKMRWVQQMLASDPSDEWCVIFPFPRHKDGYGTIGINYKVIWVHRYICELTHGTPPTPQHEAAHSCGRGNQGCVNPRHLSWKTKTENRREAAPRPRKLLDPTRAAEIRSLKGLELEEVTAARFGISIGTVRQIHAGRIWRGKGPCDREFTDAEIRRIRAAKGERGAANRLAKEYGVSYGVIQRIMNRKTWLLVPEAA